MVEALATAAGERGSMAEYLRSTVEHLEARGIHDRYLWRMQERLADRLERDGHRTDSFLGDVMHGAPRGATDGTLWEVRFTGPEARQSAVTVEFRYNQGLGTFTRR